MAFAPFVPLRVMSSYSMLEGAIATLGSHGFSAPLHLHSTQGRIAAGDGRVHLPPWGFLWVSAYA